jgi:hypothetical protein
MEHRVQEGGNDVDQAMYDRISLDDRRVDQHDANYPYENEFSRNATEHVDGDIDEGKLDPNGTFGVVQMERNTVEDEIPVVNSLREDDRYFPGQ